MTEARVRRVAGAWAAVLALVAVGLAAAVDGGRLQLSDHLLLVVAQAPATQLLDLVMTAVSALGTLEVTGVMVIVLVLTARSERPLGWRRWVPVGVFVLLTLVELAAKSLVHQPEPPAYLLRGTRLPGFGASTPFSFPSGHMTRITLVLGLVAIRRASRARHAAWLWLWLCVAAVWIIGFSRVYLGEHWPADVAAGILLGGVGIALCLAVSPRGSLGSVT